MKVSELINHLSGMDPELEVWVSADAEGNSFGKMDAPYVSYWNERYEEPIHPDDLEEYDMDSETAPLAVVIYPA